MAKKLGIWWSNFHSDWAYALILPNAHSNPRRGNQPPCLCPATRTRGLIRGLTIQQTLPPWADAPLPTWRKPSTLFLAKEPYRDERWAGPPGAGGDRVLKCWKWDSLVRDLSNKQDVNICGMMRFLSKMKKSFNLPKLSSWAGFSSLQLDSVRSPR